MTEQSEPSPYRVELEERADYLHAQILGDYAGLEAAARIWLSIARECRQRGARRLLVTHGPGRRGSAADVQRVGAIVVDLGLREVRLAVVYGAEVLAETAKLEAFAAKRGLVAKVCGSEAEAVEFLMAK